MTALTDPLRVREFILAGHATITLQSRKTGRHFTYKVEKGQRAPDHLRFVSLLTGPDNTGDYVYMGTLTDGHLRHTAKSRTPVDSLPWRAFDYLTRHVFTAGDLPADLEVRHEGRCGACGRPLTVPESIDRGIGPDCQRRLACEAVLRSAETEGE